MTDGELLSAYLAHRDTPCPKCQYNLRGTTGNHCPECGEPLVLDVSRRGRLHIWWRLAVITMSAMMLMRALNIASRLYYLMEYGQARSAADQRVGLGICVSICVLLGCATILILSFRLKRKNPMLALGKLTLGIFIVVLCGGIWGMIDTVLWLRSIL